MLRSEKEKRLLIWLLISQIYCLVLGWFNGGEKLNYLFPYFFHFFTWWCVWNCLLTVSFLIWKLKNPHRSTYFAQLFSLMVMISNLVTMGIYVIGLILWLITTLTTNWGITTQVTKLVPIPSHKISAGEVLDSKQLIKVVDWWLYSPLWHLISPAYFLYWFFGYARKNHLRKKIKRNIASCLTMLTLYFIYCYFHSKFDNQDFFAKFNSRWPYTFFSSKKMAKILGFERWVWKIILLSFWFNLSCSDYLLSFTE